MLPDFVRSLIERVAKYGFDGDYEYKVKKDIFDSHLNESGLEVIEIQKVWGPCDEPWGNYVVEVKKKQSLKPC